MTSKINLILENLKTLTLIECVELIENIEKTFNITAAISSQNTVMLNNSNVVAQSSNVAEEIEEKSSFDIILSEVPSDKKIAILKIIRNITGFGLKESKEIVDNTPKLIKENLTKDDSDKFKKELESAGAKVIVK